MSRRRILIVQPYVPSYRVPLFHELHARLRKQGIDLLVAAGTPRDVDAARGDAVQGLPWAVQLDQAEACLLGRNLHRRYVAPVLSSFRPTHIIVEQALHNLDTYEIGIWAARERVPVAMWGHGRTYTVQASRVHEAIKSWVTRQTSWFFSYTDGGRDYLVAHHYPRSRITVLRNSTDTKLLRADLAGLDSRELAAFQAANAVDPNRSALFLGGLDNRKGLPFLVEAARRVEASVPGFAVMLGGDGIFAEHLRQEQRCGAPIRVLGRLDGTQRAAALASAAVMVIPEWVGLVAVDSLASGVPIVTTRNTRHAPEFEYLVDGANCLVTDHTVASYAQGIIDLLRDPERRMALRTHALHDARGLSIEEMANRFAEGVMRWVEHSSSERHGPHQ